MEPRAQFGLTPARAIGLAFGLALGIGGWLRWFLAGAVELPGAFSHWRHAHSHLGYYGVLFPLAWAAWRRCGISIPSPHLLAAYFLATFIAAVGFVRAGYGPEAIAASTLIAAIWLISAWPLRRRLLTRDDPLALILPGVVLAEACVPPIALLLRRDPDLARAFVSTFLALLLLVVVVPSALAAQQVRCGPWPLLLMSSTSAAAALGIWPHPVARFGMGLFGLTLGISVVRGPRIDLALRLAWAAVALGLIALAAGLLPNRRPVIIGAIHFVILAPVLQSLMPLILRHAPSTTGWLLHHAAVALMSGALVAQGLGRPSWTSTLAAVGGTAVIGWWMILMFRSRGWAPRSDSTEAKASASRRRPEPEKPTTDETRR
ncbi:MAG: hypothetical protein ACFB9M_21305 [Myxococcota bacterium]